jgi:hypothetical protein
MLGAIEILLMIGLFGFVMLTVVSRTNRWNRLYDHLKQQFGKRVSKPALVRMLVSKSPALSFMYGSTPCDVSIRHFGLLRIKRRRMRLTVTWPQASRSKKSGRAGKASETLLISTDPHQKIRFVSLKDVATGSPDFRDRFHVKTAYSSDDTRLLTSNVQHFVFRIATLGQSDDMTVKLHKGKLVFSKSDIGPKFQDTADFIQQALQIFDLLRLSESWGVKFLDGADATVIEDVVCPICTGTIADDLVSCMRCQTPHCRDCWEYNGQCATFACRETRFTASMGASSVV